MQRRLLLSAVGLLAIAGCATNAPTYQPPPAAPAGMSTVVFMRHPGFGGAFWAHKYFVDGQLVAKLDVNSYTYVFVKAGSHRLHYGANADFKELLLTVDMKPGESYYYHEVRGGGGVGSAGGTTVVSWEDRVGMLPPDVAVSMLQTYGYQAPLLARVE